jgi:hypothetical protein
MALCSTCKSIPFRAIDRVFESDKKTMLAAGLENVLWVNPSHTQVENKYGPLRAWVKLKTIQKVYEEAPNCVLCRTICLAPITTPGEEVAYDIAHRREGLFTSSSIRGDLRGNEIIWMKVVKDCIEIRRGNHTRPESKAPMEPAIFAACFSVRTVTGMQYYLHHDEQVLI